MIKVELLNEVLTNRSNELAERVKELEVSNNSFREELIVYKNRVAEYGTSSDKVGQYMELALESCKGENEALKKSKKEFEKSLAEFMELNQENHTKMKSLNDQLVRCKEEVNILSQLKESL